MTAVRFLDTPAGLCAAAGSRRWQGDECPARNRQEAIMPKLSPPKSRPMKLTDTQLIVLSRAAQRDDGAAAVPEGMTQSAALRPAASLIDKKLVREGKATGGKPVWPPSHAEGRYALHRTQLGLAAICAAHAGEA